MRFCRLIILSAFLICVSLSAKAQYTSKSSNSGFTSKTSAVQKAPERSGNAFTSSPSAATAKANPYTNSASATEKKSYTTNNTAGAESASASRTGGNAGQVPASVQVRPAAPAVSAAFRPQAKITATSDDDEDSGDDIPSFDVLEGKPLTQEQQKQKVQMLEEPEGEILIYISDFVIDEQYSRPICNWKTVVQNNTNLSIQSLRFDYQLLEGMKYFVPFKNVSAGSSKERSHAEITTQCAAMKQKRLRSISLRKCKIGDVVNQGCMKYIKFK